MSVLLLGCGFTGRVAGCESVLFSTTVVYDLSKVGKQGNSLMRVALLGQPRLMPRAEKRVIECLVSTTDAQILQSNLDLVHAAGKTECSKLNVYVRVCCLTCAPHNFTVVYGNISRMRKQCIPGPLPPFGRGLGTRLASSPLHRTYLLHVGWYIWAI